MRWSSPRTRLRLPPWSTSRSQSRRSGIAPPPPPRILVLLPVVLLVGCVLILRNHRINEAEARTVAYNALLMARDLRESSHGHNATLPPNLSHDVPSYISYHSLYVKLPPALGVTLLILWLFFLFSFLGIVASDFFCPNLSTIACRLGLPDDVAGATMVGWANGAPDLFSTFASLKAGSGSLAIGELIGAASFICSIVAGSMVLVKPFKVQKFNFFRDVGFFTAAVAFSIVILRDGKIVAWESKAMIGMYVAYVVLVAGGSWYRRRRWRMKERERMIRDAWNENVSEVPPYQDNPDAPVCLEEGDNSPIASSKRRASTKSSQAPLAPLVIPSLRLNSGEREDYFSSPAPLSNHTSPGASPRLVPFASPGAASINSGTRRRSSTLVATPGGGRHAPRHHTHANTHNRSMSHHAIHMQGRMSFLGAVEFRDVVNSLQAESSANKHLAAFESPSAADRDPEVGLGMARHPSLQGRGRPKSPHGQQGQIKNQRSGASANSSRKSSRTGSESKRAVSNSDMVPEQGQGSDELGAGDEETSQVVSRPIPDIQVEDPWRGVHCQVHSPGEASSVQVSETASAKIPEWQLDTPEAEDLHSTSPGESDVTARPGDKTAENGRPSALQRFPSKALRVLGLGREDESDSIPPKAQRILGVTGEPSHPSSSSFSPSAKRFSFARFRKILGGMIYAVFPSLHNFRQKSFLAMITSLISVPAVLLLNLTLPVVDESEADEEFLEELEKERFEAEPEGQIRLGDEDDDEAIHRNRSFDEVQEDIDEQLDEMEEEEYEHNVRRSIAVAQELHSPVATHHHPAHIHGLPLQEENRHLAVASSVPLPPSREATTASVTLPKNLQMDTVQGTSELPAVDGADLTRYLTAVQCFLAPIFAVVALLGDEVEVWYIPTALGVGLVLSTTTILFFKDESHITRVLSLCCIGFFIAIVWILTIVNEVVGVLQTIGHIFGLSDAILGLTIFAMGNSLGDLVANVTVARMGYPLMALSACFGGPMLNILLGIGVSGTYITSTTHKPVHIEISTTLIVSALSLLAVLVGTLISVPMNGFVMSRKWAIGLMLVYAAVMAANIAVEIKTER